MIVRIGGELGFRFGKRGGHFLTLGRIFGEFERGAGAIKGRILGELFGEAPKNLLGCFIV